MHEKMNNKEPAYKKTDMSEIHMVDMDEDKSEIRFLLQKMSHNKWFLYIINIFHQFFLFFFLL